MNETVLLVWLSIYQGRKCRGSDDDDQTDERRDDEYNLKDGKNHHGRKGGYVFIEGVKDNADDRDDFCASEEKWGGWEQVLETLGIN